MFINVDSLNVFSFTNIVNYFTDLLLFNFDNCTSVFMMAF